MAFNSFSFLFFFVIIFAVYWGIHYSRIKEPLKLKVQNLFLLLSSYFFYGYADWKMLPLLLVSTILFWFIGIRVGTSLSVLNCDRRRASLWRLLGVILGVGLLLYFKYLDFFIESFAGLFERCGLHTNLHSFNIILPIGISFFTFKLISYVIEIYRGHIKPTEDIVDFALYVSFFPCILSGPIDRPNKFIPQIQNIRSFKYDMAVDGCRQILWGLFKKVVIADNCAQYTDTVWNSISTQCGSTLALAMVLYLFQLYADFSGYSDMAIGVGKLLGFKIADNFKTPLFALNIADYWKRWHITLTSWLTDYVFMPLNVKFRNLGNVGIVFSIIITFVLIGLWHGANWTFALFGLYHGLLFVPLILTGSFHKKAKIHCGRLGLPVWSDFLKMAFTFLLVALGLVIFRALDLQSTSKYIFRMFTSDIITVPWLINRAYYIPLFLSVLYMLFIEWKNRDSKCFSGSYFCFVVPHTKVGRIASYTVLILWIYLFGGLPREFVYFQF